MARPPAQALPQAPVVNEMAMGNEVALNQLVEASQVVPLAYESLEPSYKATLLPLRSCSGHPGRAAGLPWLLRGLDTLRRCQRGR